MIWTADTVMYDGVSMDRAYSGDTLIWCKTCPIIVCGTELVHQGEPIMKGEDYVIGNKDDGGWWLGTDGLGTSSLSSAKVFHADNNYPAVYEGLCEGYVTDLGAAFGLEKTMTPGRDIDYGYQFSNQKTSLSTFIGYDYQNLHNTAKDIIMVGSYMMQSYYLYTPNRIFNEIGFELLPGNSTSSYTTMRLYRIKYCYQT